MTAVEKFSICRALFESQTHYSAPLVVHQHQMCVNAVADVVCATLDEQQSFRRLCGKDNWIEDNPFRDDDA